MKRMTYMEVLTYCCEAYGVRHHRDSTREDTFFNCPECDEPLFWSDWAEDEEIERGCCPVCGERIVDEEGLEDMEDEE